jgi:hypothetical protein
MKNNVKCTVEWGIVAGQFKEEEDNGMEIMGESCLMMFLTATTLSLSLLSPI